MTDMSRNDSCEKCSSLLRSSTNALLGLNNNKMKTKILKIAKGAVALAAESCKCLTHGQTNNDNMNTNAELKEVFLVMLFDMTDDAIIVKSALAANGKEAVSLVRFNLMMEQLAGEDSCPDSESFAVACAKRYRPFLTLHKSCLEGVLDEPYVK